MADSEPKFVTCVKRMLKGFLIGFYLGGMGYSSRYIISYVQNVEARRG